MIVEELNNLINFVKKYVKKKRAKKKEIFKILRLISKFDMPVIMYKSLIFVFSKNKEVLETIKGKIEELNIEGLKVRILDRKFEISYDLEELGELTINIKYYILMIGRFELPEKEVKEKPKRKRKEEEIPPYIYT